MCDVVLILEKWHIDFCLLLNARLRRETNYWLQASVGDIT